jgi:hypothetical protein
MAWSLFMFWWFHCRNLIGAIAMFNNRLASPGLQSRMARVAFVIVAPGTIFV